MCRGVHRVHIRVCVGMHIGVHVAVCIGVHVGVNIGVCIGCI